MLKKILLALLVVLIVIQFFRPEKNLSGDSINDISKKYPMPDSVHHIFQIACYDCHSNTTRYPWYSYVQPVSWWMNDHIEHGKHHVNYSDYTSAPLAVQNHRLEETIEVLDENEMPLDSYTWLGMHPEAKITDAQKQTLIRWAKAQMDTLKAQYPPDSLILKRRKPAEG